MHRDARSLAHLSKVQNYEKMWLGFLCQFDMDIWRTTTDIGSRGSVYWPLISQLKTTLYVLFIYFSFFHKCSLKNTEYLDVDFTRSYMRFKKIIIMLITFDIFKSLTLIIYPVNEFSGFKTKAINMNVVEWVENNNTYYLPIDIRGRLVECINKNNTCINLMH